MELKPDGTITGSPKEIAEYERIQTEAREAKVQLTKWPDWKLEAIIEVFGKEKNTCSHQ